MFDTKNLAAQSDVERKERAVYFFMQEKAQAGKILASDVEAAIDFIETSDHKHPEHQLRTILKEYDSAIARAEDNLEKEIGRRFV